MRTTGIVRRIDDLGRIVIPKEIRRSLGIVENSPMEIFIEGDSVILKLYEPGYITDLEKEFAATVEELQVNPMIDNADIISLKDEFDAIIKRLKELI